MKVVQRLHLEIPAESHKSAYVNLMDRWEASGEKIAPQLLSRQSAKGGNVPYARWLEWCEDDRTTGAALATKVPCTLYFLTDGIGEIFGSVVINHDNTRRGHMHVGIAPWHRQKGYGTAIVKLALDECRRRGFRTVDIVPYRGNEAMEKIIQNNGGTLRESFLEDGAWSDRYSIAL